MEGSMLNIKHPITGSIKTPKSLLFLPHLSSDNLNTIAERNLEIYDILIQIKERKRETL